MLHALGPDADVLVVYAKTDPKLGHKGITSFLVEKNFKGNLLFILFKN